MKPTALEEELVRAKERLELTQEATGITSWEWDLATDLMIWTAGAQNLIRLKGNLTQPHKEVLDAIHPDDREATRAAAYRAVERNEPYLKEFRVVLPGGAERWILSRGKVFHDAAGKPERMLGVNMDITERKLTEKALRDSEQRFRATFEQAPAGIAHVLSNSRFALVNQRFLTMFGYTAGEMAGMGIADIITDEAMPDAVKSRDKLFSGEVQSYTDERTYRRKDGSTLPCEVNASCVRHPDGSVHYVIIVLTDLTQIRQATEALQKARQAADAANQAKSQFLANVSHEIRTPLTAILGFVELLKTPLANETRRLHYLDVINRNGQMLQALIDDLLDLSRIESGRTELDRDETSLFALLAELETAFGRVAAQKQLHFQVVRDPEVPDTIFCDAMRLKQVLQNVIGNALKFTDRGSVVVSVAVVPPRAPEAVTLAFAVRDTGVGIDAGQRLRIFNAFSQGDASTTRRFGGTGLGLALSRHLARLLGGDLVLKDSQPGEGSTFVVTLPAPLARAAGGAAGDGAAAPLRGVEILLAESCADTRMYFVEVLERAGAQVESCADGGDLVDRALAGRYPLVLLEAQLSGHDCCDLAAALRARGYAGKIVAVSAQAHPAERQRCLAAGCTAVIGKPVRPSELVATILASLG